MNAAAASGLMDGMLKYAVIATIVGLSAVAGLFAGCTNTIRAPAEPAETRALYLLDLGHHTRLVFGLPDGDFVEYGYGEWRWYAKMENQWWRVPAVLLWPTQGALGRRHWRGLGAEARLLEEYAGVYVLELPAARDKVDALVAGLDRHFERHSKHLFHNAEYGLDFVPVDCPYWFGNNSNHAVRAWLQRAGYTVSGPGMLAKWKLDDAARP